MGADTAAANGRIPSFPITKWVTELGYDGTDVEDLERVTEDGAVEITCSFTQEYLEEAWENQVAQVEKSYAF